MFERIKFWNDVRNRKAPFWYDKKTATHYAVESYNPFTDMVSYRYGQFGECDFGPYPMMRRNDYLNLSQLGYTNER
jgi:hypothetical protein